MHLPPIPPKTRPSCAAPNVYEPPAPKVYTRWSGFYAGGQMEYGSAHLDFSQATQSLAAFSLRGLALENENRTSPKFEILRQQAYRRRGLRRLRRLQRPVGGHRSRGRAELQPELLFRRGDELPRSAARFRRAATRTSITVDGSALHAHQRLCRAARTRRLRDGQCFMPYVSVGFAIGRADFTRSWAINGTENPGTANAGPFTFTNSEAKSNVFMYGWSVGAGVDVALMEKPLRARRRSTTSRSRRSPASRRASWSAAWARA